MTPQAYEESVEIALDCGYHEVKSLDHLAYNGSFFIKNNQKWIHDIDYLRAKLGGCTDTDLESKGYNVEDYYKYRQYGLQGFHQIIESQIEAYDYEDECKQFLANKGLNSDDFDSTCEKARSLGFNQ